MNVLCPQPARDDASKDGVSNASATPRWSPLTFFLLVFALSVPIWLLGTLIELQLLEGLSISSLMTFVPLIAALILTYRETGGEGAKELLKRAFDYRRIRAKAWYAPIVLLMPAVMVLTYGLMRWMRLPLPTPHIPVLVAPVMFLVFFVGATGEEVGWMGHAIDPMQDRWNALQASLLLGVVGATWHIVPFLQTHRSLAWIAWQSLFIVASRVLTVWLYNNTGKSVFAAILYHDISNVSSFLFPNYGSHYDPRIVGLITAFVAAIVTVVWGPRTLARYRNAWRSRSVARKLSLEGIRERGYEWPKYALVEEYAVVEGGQVDLSTTLENLRSSRAFYRRQLNEAYAFKTSTGADYSDFTDRFDEYARMERELGQAIAYLEEIAVALAP